MICLLLLIVVSSIQSMDDATIIYICATCFRLALRKLLVQKVIEIATYQRKPVTVVSLTFDFQQTTPDFMGAADHVLETGQSVFKQIFPRVSARIIVDATWGEAQYVTLPQFLKCALTVHVVRHILQLCIPQHWNR